MKLGTTILSALAASLLFTFLTNSALVGDKLAARAKISKSAVTKTALAKVPGGKVKEGGLEEENGRLIWSFDIATKGPKDLTEIAVDAITGEIITVANETPAQQAAEKAADAWPETITCADEAFGSRGRNAYPRGAGNVWGHRCWSSIKTQKCNNCGLASREPVPQDCFASSGGPEWSP